MNFSIISKSIGKSLSILRLSRGYSQAKISDILNIAQSTYAGYETGRHEPNISTLLRIANLYGVSLDYIVGRYDNTPTENIPEPFLDEIIYLNSEDRKQENIEIMVDLHKEKQNSLLQKRNRVKKNKPRTQKTN